MHSVLTPVPFRLKVPGRDTVSFDGVESVTYRLDGLLHLRNDIVTLEWTGSESVDHVSLSKVATEVEHFPVEYVEIPVRWVVGAEVRGGWWYPRLELRTSRIELLESVPSSRGGAVDLRLRRRDRQLARALAVAIELASADAALADAEIDAMLDEPDEPRLGGGPA